MPGTQADGVSRAAEFAGNLERFGFRNGLFTVKEPAVLSDGAACILNVCEEILPERRAVFILDQCHALEYAATAVRVLAPDEGKRTAWIKMLLNAGPVARVIAVLKPHRDRDEAVEACIVHFEANKDRMRCDRYRKRGLPIGSGVVESACRQVF